MKANELRIGNWVKIPDKPEEIIIPCIEAKVQGIGLFGNIEFLNTPQKKGVVWSVKSITGILLTEQWLKEFGFGKVRFNYEKEWLLLHKHMKRGTFDFLINEPHSNKLHITQLINVHQLQNLYFALTGEELTKNAKA